MIDRYEIKSIKEIFSDAKRFELYSIIELLRIEHCTFMYENTIVEFNKDYFNVSEKDLKQIKFIENETKHEIAAFLSWFDKYCVSNKYLHYKLTSSDLLDAALNIQIKQAKEIVQEKYDDLYFAMLQLMNKYNTIPYMARTHGQLAKETTLGHLLNLKIEHLERAYTLFDNASNELNFCKIAGPVGVRDLDLLSFQEKLNEYLKMNNKEIEVTQIVPRDLYANLIYSMCALGAAIEKIALDIRLMSQSGIEEVSERFAENQVGSSAMPHKKNPIVCENITGLYRVLKSYLQPAIENISLWGYRDMTHSSVERIIIPDSFHLICNMLSKMTDVIDSLNVNKEKLESNITDVNVSTKILAKLSELFGYNKAYEITQNIMFDSDKLNKKPNDLLYERYQIKIEQS